ncbi:glucose-6-phosphate dehydrogenase [Clostridium sp. CX1]|uniref:glucose-6-phosphate dehydrogenase n=1 Tax=Clostridium sp. CX1 TaxID=2978346 RepID=UPI0021BEB326|nr:glucose-6-phosphate dehydrogenase [Clostridium sp. CX1]MCT8977405.1 glucose-6-phosphate dehydrogenase [Clostridium sp. CX1]
MEITKDLSCVMTIFGGTGDLAHRKLMPAIYNLLHENMLPENFAVVAVGRRDLSHEEYRDSIYQSIQKFSRLKIDNDLWSILRNKIYYSKFSFDDNLGYSKLNEFLKALDKEYHTNGNRMYYLAVAPEYFEVIVDKLNNHNMVDTREGFKRVVIEKPFGRDLKSAQYLNKKITEVFSENNTYRIDHYLGKEMIQNIMIIRFANSIFEPIWNNKYIDNIQITAIETVGVENRGGYYEKAGALRDMVQNHMLQLLTLTAMEPPPSLKTEHIRDEKVKVLQSLEKLTPEFIKSNVVRGQYGAGSIEGKVVPAYRNEANVSPESKVETFAALKMHVQNFRWAGVPFYIRSGKRLDRKSTEITVQFKELPNILYFKENKELQPNLLSIKVNPMEGVVFQFNGKEPGSRNNILPLQMDFCQNCEFESNTPEAYERLLYDVMKGDPTLFTRWDEVEYSWKFVDSILEAWKSEENSFPNYEAGSNGPREAELLLSRDNRKWWNIESNSFCARK